MESVDGAGWGEILVGTADEMPPNGFSRRRFLIVGGAGVAATGLATELPILRAAAAAPTFTLDLVRREDMAVLTFEFHNLALNTGGPTPMLNRVDTAQPSLVLVRLTSQHLMEQPTPWVNAEPNPLPRVGEISSKAVGPSRIAFLVPQTVKSFPYTEDGLFTWWGWVMQVHGRALAPDATIPAETDLPPVDSDPGDLQTDLLLVDWLHLSPDGSATWLHPARPVTKDGRTEVWHTTLRLRNDDGRPDTSRRTPTIRAVSRDDKDLKPGDEKFTVLRPTSQEFVPQQIVRATTDYHGSGVGEVVQPVTAELLLLSALGSSVELAGNWDRAAELSIARWLHRSTIGRDNYVRVETYGFLFPFGHRAVLVSESQRRIASNGVAYLFQKQFIVVRQPVKSYPGHGDDRYEGRRSPFREVRLTTTVTPDLPTTGRDPVGNSTKSFWVPTQDPATQTVSDLPFPIVATDWEGRTVQFNAPLAYIDATEAVVGPVLTNLINQYGRYDTFQAPFPTDAEKKFNARRTVAMPGEKVSFTKPIEPGDTAYPVTQLYLGAYQYDIPDNNPPHPQEQDLVDRDLPNFYPAMLAAKVRIQALEALAQQSNDPFIAYDPLYTTTPVAKAAAENQFATFARVQANLTSLGEIIRHLEDPGTVDPPDHDATISVTFGGTGGDAKGGDKVGGVALPNLEVGALSQTHGPLSGDVKSISEMAKGDFKAEKAFPPSAKLLGDITLKDVVDDTGNGATTFITTLEYDTAGKPVALITTFAWRPRVFGPDTTPPGQNPASFGPFIPYGEDGKHATLELQGKFRTVFVGDEEPTSDITGKLENFTLDLLAPNTALDFIAIVFRRFTFKQHNDAKPTFEPAIAKVEFRGPLKFINALQEYLPVYDGLKVELEPNAVLITQDFPIPDVPLGIFRLTGLGFSAKLTLPFTGEPVSVEFGFASPENRFNVSVLCLGGGGYFLLELNVNRIIKVEGALEFGGSFALSIGIASGKLEVMAGIYFKWEYVEKSDSNEVTLRGYLRALGQVRVLGLITISAEFMLALEYRSADNAVEGTAKLKVTIEIAFFSKSVTLEVKKRFNGPSSEGARALAAAPHDFGDLISQSDWNTYTESFAG